MFYFKLFVCVFYGLVSIAQTLTNRYLFRTLNFPFYSTVTLFPPRSSCFRDFSSSPLPQQEALPTPSAKPSC